MEPVNKTSTRDKMFQIIKQALESNMTNREFCRENSIHEHVFYYWLRRYKEDQSPVEGFIPIKVNGSPPSFKNDKIEIQYPNGIHLSLPGHIEVNRIKTLIGLK